MENFILYHQQLNFQSYKLPVHFNKFSAGIKLKKRASPMFFSAPRIHVVSLTVTSRRQIQMEPVIPE
ncbi:MAG: hypothetical protein CVT49_13315 [candidate division Zixibacteria bacterium HGW-Zixibacteria-1]|nr:MAG: hypothetical protein CVT49_13315 [candidate division Zixibacteria bacterium HGW-Zixibacteria-1]